MRRHLLLLLLLLATVLLLTESFATVRTASANVPFMIPETEGILEHDFIRTNGMRFEDSAGTPFFVKGINYWSCMNLAADAEAGGDLERLRNELDTLKHVGVNVIRIMAASEGAPTKQPFRIYPSLQPSPGRWDERIFRGLDRCIVEAGRRGMRVVMVMGNTWQWTGGIAQLHSWSHNNTLAIPYPRAWDIHAPPQRTDGYAGWGDWFGPSPDDPDNGDFMRFQEAFYDDDDAKSIFAQHLERVMDRKNSISGRIYSQDPTIFAWEPLNEPQIISSFTASQSTDEVREDSMIAWHHSVSTLIKRKAPQQLSTTGFEAKQGKAHFMALHAHPSIDFTCAHIWAEIWGHYDKMDASSVSLTRAKTFVSAFLQDAERWSRELNKPLVLEELGMARDVWQNVELGTYLYHTDASTTHRDEYYAHVYKIVCDDTHPSSFAGIMPWSFGGRLRSDTQTTNAYDMVFAGDPPQEPPGWFSILDNDSTTLDLMKHWYTKVG